MPQRRRAGNIHNQAREMLMRRNILLSSLVILAAAVTGSAQTPAAKPPGVTIVIVLQNPNSSPANVAKLVAGLAKARKIAATYKDPGKARLYASTYAGNEAGSFVITVEYPSMLAMAQAEGRMQASKEWQDMVAEVMATGFKPVSQSLVTEVPY
jgi:hypothetical protein